MFSIGLRNANGWMKLLSLIYTYYSHYGCELGCLLKLVPNFPVDIKYAIFSSAIIELCNISCPNSEGISWFACVK